MRRHRPARTLAILAAAATLIPAPSAWAADTFTAPAYTDPDCAFTFGADTMGLTPDMIASVVGLPIALPATPAPQTFVIVSLGESADQADVRGMLQFCGLNPVTWTDVLWAGDAAPALGSEATLDLTVVAGILPSNTTLKTATIASGVNFRTALINTGNACGLDGTDWTQWRRSQLDTPTGGCIASMSYSVFEDGLTDVLALNLGITTAAAQEAWFNDVEAILAALASSGVITVVSSGDEGSGGCEPYTRGLRNTMGPQWPSSNVNVLSVGGTMWAPPNWNGAPITPTDYVPGQTLMPVTWRNWNLGSDCYWDGYNPGTTLWPGIGTTGGISEFDERPSYQNGVASAVPGSTGRLSPDLSGLAGWPTWLVPIYNGPGATFSMGTSAAAPLTAVGLAHVNAALTSRGMTPLDNSGGALDIHEVIYSPAFASAFNDVTQGSNNLWSSDIWSGPTAITTQSAVDTAVPGFFTGATQNGNTSASITGYSAATGYDLATGLGVPNFSTLATLLIAAQTPAPGGPPPVLQQLPAPESGSCDQTITAYDWGGASAGGWSRSWAQWTNGGRGGPVCTRTLVYSNALRHWLVQP
jgi:hypothetical protein